MAKKSSGQKIFNDRPRKVFRKTISSNEVVFSAAFVGVVLAMTLWFIVQKENYDPAERDISMDVMLASSVEDDLYEPPLLRWIDPAKAAQGGGGPAAPEIGIMPGVILENGWQPSSRLEEFDKTNLYEKINGQEVQYHSYGFEHLHFISVRNEALDIDANIEVYDMADFSNALGIFAAQRSEGTTVEQNGPAMVYETEAGAIGLIGQFYLKVSGSADSAEMRKLGRDFVAAFASENAAVVAIPLPMTLLTEGVGVDSAGIEYVREDVFQYAFAKNFWFGRPVEDKSARYYVHESASEEEAAALIGQILEEHAYDYSVVLEDGAVTVLQHTFLKNFFSISHTGSFVIGMERADTQEEALAGAARMNEVVSNQTGNTRVNAV